MTTKINKLTLAKWFGLGLGVAGTIISSVVSSKETKLELKKLVDESQQK